MRLEAMALSKWFLGSALLKMFVFCHLMASVVMGSRYWRFLSGASTLTIRESDKTSPLALIAN